MPTSIQCPAVGSSPRRDGPLNAKLACSMLYVEDQ